MTWTARMASLCQVSEEKIRCHFLPPVNPTSWYANILTWLTHSTSMHHWKRQCCFLLKLLIISDTPPPLLPTNLPPTIHHLFENGFINHKCAVNVSSVDVRRLRREKVQEAREPEVFQGCEWHSRASCSCSEHCCIWMNDPPLSPSSSLQLTEQEQNEIELHHFPFLSKHSHGATLNWRTGRFGRKYDSLWLLLPSCQAALLHTGYVATSCDTLLWRGKWAFSPSESFMS